MTEGQRLAREQIREIEAASNGAVEVMSVREPDSPDGVLAVTVSLYCGNLTRVVAGIPLRDRERFVISVPPDFPFELPSVDATHTRFAGYPHVQWMRRLCLYQAPSTEWDPSDGMFGFVARLEVWLRKAALDELDPIGAPLHPPVVYVPRGPIRLVIPRVNAPTLDGNTWFGTAHLRGVTKHRVDITGWSPWLDKETPEKVAAALLLNEPMPFEFPTNVRDLFAALDERGVPLCRVLVTLQGAILRNPADAALLVIIGTPQRGVRGSGQERQHLTAWYLTPDRAAELRAAIDSYSDESGEIRELGEDARAAFLKWAEEAEIEWCYVREDRPEIITRRDHDSPVSWFANKVVSLWGCGALGGHIAEFLVRTGVRKLIVRDRNSVNPGILTRQPYADADIGNAKSEVLRNRLLHIRPGVEIVHHHANLLASPLNDEDWSDGADLVIDTTGSEAVLSKLELRRRASGGRCVPVVSMSVGHRADRSFAVLAGAEYSGGPNDAIRKAKIEACNRSEFKSFADEFFPPRDGTRRVMFQPEPGCSDPTFVGSQADAAALAGIMLNQVAGDLALENSATATGYFFTQPHALGSPAERASARFSWPRDLTSRDPHAGYEIRIAESAWSDICAWIESSRRHVGPNVETGGLLFGERDDAARVMWVTEVSGPPPDSLASAELFECGVVGTVEMSEEKSRRSRHSVQFVGMWHSHPKSSPMFSDTDFEGMKRLAASTDSTPAKSLLLIVGTPRTNPRLGTYVFSRSDFQDPDDPPARKCEISSVAERTPRSRRIGLALSGGGFRAIAFHLGCLRALHDRGLLSQVDIVSAVSGGAVIGAMYAYSNDSFEEFEARVVALLREGLARCLARRTFVSRRFPAALAVNVVSGTASIANGLAKWAASRVRRVLKAENHGFLGPTSHSPLRRAISRTTAFEDVLRKVLFGDARLADARRYDIDVVINACELRTGSAFRFGSSLSRCWRFGALVENNVPVALAVAASAAYPVFLPAIDRFFVFRKKDSEARHRVLLTDGGVFDNLGVTCLEPGRQSEFSYGRSCPDYIISCDAGAGLLSEHNYPYYWASRMQRAFEAVYRKANDATRGRMHDYAASGRLRGFVLSYLGQDDRKLPYLPPDLVRREEVMDYPTDLSAMKLADIERIALRGEQLTRLLISRYCPEL